MEVPQLGEIGAVSSGSDLEFHKITPNGGNFQDSGLALVRGRMATGTIVMRIMRCVEWLSKTLALIGGLALLAITAITCISILGRVMIPLGLGPIPGDFELVQVGVGFAIFAFLPWCQINRGHAAVDILTNFFPKAVNRWIDLLAETLMGCALLVMTWKLWDGTATKLRYGDTTFILEIPIWWAYAACLFAAAIGCVIAIYMIGVRAVEVATGKSLLNLGFGAVH